MYAKIFRQIFESSIAENYELRHIFMDLLVLADRDGIIDQTPESISRATNIPLDKIHWAIGELSKPDPRSRNPDAHGARLKKLDDHRDWGWLIINFDIYHKLASDEQRRERTKERVRAYRMKTRVIPLETPTCNAPVTQCNEPVTPPSVCVSTCTSSSSNTNTDLARIEKAKKELSELFGRKLNAPWSYAEEYELARIVKRPDFDEEWHTIERYQMSGHKARKQGVYALLQDWNDVLDRAREHAKKD